MHKIQRRQLQSNVLSFFNHDYEELEPEKSASLSAHLLTCVACSKDYAELMRLRTSIKKNAVNFSAISDTNPQELASFHQLLAAQSDKETPKP